jgi:plasmid stabilization system protein ParE
MKYHVRLANDALQDYDALLTYIKNQSPAGAKAWGTAFDDAMTRIEANPLLCGLIPERRRLLVQYREAFFKTRKGRRYRIIFSLEENIVWILYIRGPGQDFIDREPLRLP